MSAPIKINLKGLADFILAGPYNQRSLLKRYKYPKIGRPLIVYYQAARNLIEDYHENARPPEWLFTRAAYMTGQARLMDDGFQKSQLRNNARVLRRYARFFGNRHFEVLRRSSFPLVYGQVRITVFPDLHVREGRNELWVKFDFGEDPPLPRSIQVFTQAIFEALSQSGTGVRTRSVQFFDIHRGRTFPGGRMGARMARDIEAACRNIEALWPDI